jgi:hypothetical protein
MHFQKNFEAVMNMITARNFCPPFLTFLGGEESLYLFRQIAAIKTRLCKNQ